MKLSNRRKVCFAVLALGVVALILDRTMLGPAGGDDVQAETALPVRAAKASLVGGDALDRGLAVLSVGERLEQFRQTREGAGISDAFAAVGGWFERAAQKQAPTPVDSDEAFKLGSISSESHVTVNGTTLVVGHDQQVVLHKGGTGERRVMVRLISVDKRERRAVIETEGQLLELKLSGPENDKK